MSATSTNWQTQPRDSHGRFGETSHAEPDVDLDSGDGPRIEAIYSDLDREERLDAIKADLTTAISDIVASGKLSHWLDQMSSNGMTRWSSRTACWPPCKALSDVVTPNPSSWRASRAG